MKKKQFPFMYGVILVITCNVKSKLKRKENHLLNSCVSSKDNYTKKKVVYI